MATCSPRVVLSLVTVSCLVLASVPAPAAVPNGPAQRALARRAAERQGEATGDTFRLYDGSTVTLGADGFGARTDTSGRMHPLTMLRPAGRSAMGGFGPDARSIIKRASLPERGRFVPGELLVALENPSSISAAAREADVLTGDPAADGALRGAGAISARPLVAASPGSAGARPSLDLSRLFVVRMGAADPVTAAAKLRGAPGIAYAGPNWIVSSMALEPHTIPAWVADRARDVSAPPESFAAKRPATVPVNYGL